MDNGLALTIEQRLRAILDILITARDRAPGSSAIIISPAELRRIEDLAAGAQLD